jgi:hypothetical protein
MCVTVQYLFNCGHEATHRFRTNMCPIARSRDCRIQDTNKWLGFPCRRCAKSRHSSWKRYCAGAHADSDQFVDHWAIPSRCFVDVGFRTLDPFAKEVRSVPVSPLTPNAPSLGLPRARKTQSMWVSNPASDVCVRFMARMKLKRSSPCCDSSTSKGAFQAVRLEGCRDRIEGRIVENHCESMT